MSIRNRSATTLMAGLGALLLTVLVADSAFGQEPAKPDSSKKVDSLSRRPPVMLPAVHTEAPRVERRLFETKPNVSTLSVSARDLGSAPRFFAEADVLRSLQLMPGVEARNDYTTGMNVRGGEADQNLILLDGYPVYNPFHFGGLFGTFIDPAVGRVDMLTGGFPALYGGRLSSVLNVRSAEDDRSGLHGTSEVSLVASTLSLGGALGAGGSWLVAGRRTYADQAVDLVKKNAFPYHFYDLETHLAYTLPGGIRVGLTAYGGDDLLHYDAAKIGERQHVSWGNRVIGTTISKTFVNLPDGIGDSAVVEQRVSESLFDLNTEISGGGFSLTSSVHDLRTGGSISAYSPSHTHSLGYEIAGQRLAYSVNYPVPLFPSDSLAQRVRSVSAYADELWRLTPALLVEGGIRYDNLAATRSSVLLPRLSVKYFMNKDLAVTAAFGEYAQWIRSLAREDIPLRPVDYWVGSDSLTPMSRAEHYVLGVERWVTSARAFRIEGFYKRYNRLLEPNPFDDPQVRGDEFLPVTGWSTGADVMLRQFESGRFGGWIAYTYTLNSRTEATGYRFFPSQDRRHDVNLVGSWRFPRYTLAARFNVATGTPYTAIIGEFDRFHYDPIAQDYYTTKGALPGLQFLTGPRNGERLPASQRLDISLTRNFLPGRVSVTPYLSIMNVYNAHNVFGYVFNYTASPPERVSLPQLPIFPTFGLSISW